MPQQYQQLRPLLVRPECYQCQNCDYDEDHDDSFSIVQHVDTTDMHQPPQHIPHMPAGQTAQPQATHCSACSWECQWLHLPVDCMKNTVILLPGISVGLYHGPVSCQLPLLLCCTLSNPAVVILPTLTKTLSCSSNHHSTVNLLLDDQAAAKGRQALYRPRCGWAANLQ